MLVQLERPDVGLVMRGLRNFQRDTVEYVFDRMYGADPVRRFLVADEVGLGKTMVARGLIAKVVDKLWDDVPRIDVLYICSNASIARQNVSRLNITNRSDIALPSRITLLPSKIRDLERNRLNFISFTPGTSFDLRSSLGTVEERALVYQLLPDEWKTQRYTAETLFSGNASRATFDWHLREFARQALNERLRIDFQQELLRKLPSEGETLLKRFGSLCESVGRRQKLDDVQRPERDHIIGELRAALATSCIEALEPDLIILDEFQRFKHLLDGQDGASALARRLFAYGDTRVLLLSATPYKMYTLDDEVESDDHFADFLQTLSFLHDDHLPTEKLKETLNAYRRAVCQYGTVDGDVLVGARDAVTAALRRVIVRTERLAVTADRNGMLKDVASGHTPLLAADIEQYLALQRISRAVDGGDAMEYWKSAPYLLNFMDDYDVKRRFVELVERGGSPELVEAVAAAAAALLSPEDVEKYRRIDPANVRLRSLFDDLENCGAWDVSWVPPSMPYYESAGPFAGRARALTKRLIFSAWQVVPKALAAILSYEAERRLLTADGDSAANVDLRARRDKAGGSLRFTVKDDKPANMTVVGLMYPSFALASSFDPMETALRLRKENGAQLPSLDAVLRDTEIRLLDPLRQLANGKDGPVDDRWYWAAPVLLDRAADAEATRRWLALANLKDYWRPQARTTEDGDERTDAWSAHVDELRAIADGNGLGRQPDDLAQVVALLAVAGFGVIALRSLARVTRGLALARRMALLPLRTAAGRIADGWLTLFNLPETEAAVHRLNDAEPYWRRALEYAAAGGAQAVLDEYAHVLVDALGLKGRRPCEIATGISEEISEALHTRAATVGVNYVDVDDQGRVRIDSGGRKFRARFAVRFGARATDEGSSAERDDVVRRAFNSPFWPFVLCSTSVGQEGLDFHQYCHAVVHWNVPSNPVDLEQREGRVHRYKNHAVRKNVASSWSAQLAVSEHPDPWHQAFRWAEENRGEGSDLTPYWVFLPTPGGAQIERHIPLIPLSTDCEQAVRVRRALAAYRLAFGQSRQQDLVAYLTNSLSPEQIEKATDLFRIDLSPPRAANGSEFSEAEDEATDMATDFNLSEVDVDAFTRDLDLDLLRDLLDSFSLLHGNANRSFSPQSLRDLLDKFRELTAGVTT
jgi:Helicase conserved C-terminal domain